MMKTTRQVPVTVRRHSLRRSSLVSPGRVLVTGANGFIGTNLVHALAGAGAKITALVYPGSGQVAEAPGIETIETDLSRAGRIDRICKRVRPATIFHLAALTDNDRSFRTTYRALNSNVIGTVNLLAAAHGRGCRRIVVASSCEVYGESKRPYVETHSLAPVSPYSAAKAAADCFCTMLHKTQNVPVVILRFTLVYGPYQPGRMLIPQVIRSCLSKKRFNMTRGEQARDLIYVTDAVDALLRGARVPGIEGHIFNIGSGKELPVRDLVSMIIARAGSHGIVRAGTVPYRVPELWHYRCNPAKARKLLGWRPTVGLTQGLSRTIDWFMTRAGKKAWTKPI